LRKLHYGAGHRPRRVSVRCALDDVEAATRLLRPLIGQALNQLCVGVGDVQLNFDRGLSLQFESDVMRADGVGAPVQA
jgi:hypothetical protein